MNRMMFGVNATRPLRSGLFFDAVLRTADIRSDIKDRRLAPAAFQDYHCFASIILSEAKDLLGGYSMGFLFALLILFGGTADHLAAQWPASITTGARVQVRLPEVQYQFVGRRGHPLRGKVAALAPDTLYLAVADSLGPLPIPRQLIERLEYSRGVPSRGASALRQGLMSGVSSALFLVLLNELDDDTGWRTGTAALVGGGVGLAVGGITGALFPTERWKRAKWEENRDR
jgi:hypothetical protein